MDPRRQKSVERVAKLLAQATSSNVHEAEVARRRADELRQARGITQEEIDEYLDASGHAFEDGGALGDDFWQIRIALAVADRTGCRAMKKENRLIFDGSPKRAKRAAAIYAPIARDIENGCMGVYASFGHPPVFAPVLKPILLEEAARAVAERVLQQAQKARFPVPPEPQQELLMWSKGATGSAHCARMHMDIARISGRAVGLAINIGEI